ncbi:hypothetical protein [Hydrogenovibrio marinus]|nr:hypothetical protein [Hydrogenovibrio marinus]
MELRSIHHSLSVLPGEKLPKGRLVQNGVKYKTLCDNCNNNILGAKCDGEFGVLTHRVSEHLYSGIQLPGYSTFSVRIAPQKIMRSVLGHLKALGVERYEMGRFTEPVRDYLLNTSLPLPEGIKVYYWLHPYRRNVTIRDAALASLELKSTCNFWLLKFYPLAFMVTFNQGNGFSRIINAMDLDRYGSLDFDQEVDLPILFDERDIKHPYWPEAPEDSTMVFYGEESYDAIQKVTKPTF